jgi:hypothetical protein
VKAGGRVPREKMLIFPSGRRGKIEKSLSIEVEEPGRP